MEANEGNEMSYDEYREKTIKILKLLDNIALYDVAKILLCVMTQIDISVPIDFSTILMDELKNIKNEITH